MNTKTLRLAALSLALILPVSFMSAGCKKGGCRRGQVKHQVTLVSDVQPSVVAATPAPTKEKPVSAAQVENKDLETEEDNEEGSSWLSWVLGGGAVAAAAVAGYFFLYKAGRFPFNKKAENANGKAPAQPSTNQAGPSSEPVQK
jgi:hypothetical protein